MEKQTKQRKYFSEESPAPLTERKFSGYRLHVENFLTIKNVEMDISKFTILIGPQAEGKSILAKLCYFFLGVLHNCGRYSTLQEIKSTSLETFAEYFPKGIWDDSKFFIQFTCDGYVINLKYDVTDGIAISFNELLSTDIKFVNRYRKESIEAVTFIDKLKYERIFIQEAPYPFIQRNIFIPALRQFYSQIQNRTFTFLHTFDTKGFDPFVEDFGSYYERAKRIGVNASKKIQSFNKKVKHILKGMYKKIQNKDYIINSFGKEIPLTIASSGQQEVLPLLMVMNSHFTGGIFIEEPEAHLFPSTQKDIICDIARIVNSNRSNSVFITTHSPYILSALNNLIAAHDVLETKNEQKVKEMEKILPRDRWLNFDDVKCFYLEDGKIEDIMDEDLRMIDFTKIDECSSSIIDEMNKVLAVLNEGDDDNEM